MLESGSIEQVSQTVGKLDAITRSGPRRIAKTVVDPPLLRCVKQKGARVSAKLGFGDRKVSGSAATAL